MLRGKTNRYIRAGHRQPGAKAESRSATPYPRCRSLVSPVGNARAGTGGRERALLRLLLLLRCIFLGIVSQTRVSRTVKGEQAFTGICKAARPSPALGPVHQAPRRRRSQGNAVPETLGARRHSAIIARAARESAAAIGAPCVGSLSGKTQKKNSAALRGELFNMKKHICRSVAVGLSLFIKSPRRHFAEP
ncbi:hypothetical protein SKAU_G00309780 [Synaphobranchus kaupii]|uniref:Uncharacterized protein n=1 Tax=Synaphobranchus kaupii TaxID=118154 RepID=A0A9Q1ERM4_SYNKA|nr:hypothetical protein SKAU_G00309780 [Synaphobranchus kaupii]